MQKIIDQTTNSQAAHSPEPPKQGIDIVKSAFLPLRCFRGSCPYRRHFYLANDWADAAKISSRNTAMSATLPPAKQKALRLKSPVEEPESAYERETRELHEAAMPLFARVKR